MPVFAVTYEYSPDSARLGELRPEHRAFLSGLHDAGSVIVSGPLPADDGGAGGALILIEADDADAVATLLDTDPFRREGLIAERTVRDWLPVIGSLGR
ncbi:YCII-related protein [Xylanimonas cellulosilytica DSM 15894]|uniref:YCII-related protein n=1 Tax=Xylanimonas cellulosilytica (strain DSM 15894 / JCM 12276 / CECT 5975 / KCTC 9989 / LMG 20990 / NBRC 107835 / XIL07) TaxID=446471 RepID=D1BS78_XYLCX|nr:YciI family protein [Xylanimonas cellulosilytica]ACZ30570.1 YCII-related protein [Xylanimonas cellulosilytica DSM 15894]